MGGAMRNAAERIALAEEFKAITEMTPEVFAEWESRALRVVFDAPEWGWEAQLAGRPVWQTRLWEDLKEQGIVHPERCGCVDCLLHNRRVTPKFLDCFLEPAPVGVSTEVPA